MALVEEPPDDSFVEVIVGQKDDGVKSHRKNDYKIKMFDGKYFLQWKHDPMVRKGYIQNRVKELKSEARKLIYTDWMLETFSK